MKDKHLMWFGAIVLIVLLVVGGVSLSAWITQLAWNFVMPALFHLPKITFIMALALNILIGLIKPVFNFTQRK